MNPIPIVTALIGVILTVLPAGGEEPPHPRLRAEAHRLDQQGHFAEAFARYRALCLEIPNDPALVADDFRRAVACLQSLGRLSEVDAFREAAIARHAANHRLLLEAARSYRDIDHFGFLIAGAFHRGPHRGGGEAVYAFERDRVRALQLMRQALPLVEREAPAEEAGAFYMDFAGMVASFAGMEPFRLHAATDLDTLPDYEKRGPFMPRFGGGAPPAGAAVDAEDRPLFHALPESFAAAATDGERWRWLLKAAGDRHPPSRPQALYAYASFLHEQFGVETLRDIGPILLGRQAEAAPGMEKEAAPYLVHTLSEEETLARLATGVRRFTLPAEHNFIRLLEEAAGGADARVAGEALKRLAEIHENRRQYDRALAYWERFEALDPPQARERIAQIAGRWGAFEGTGVQPAGRRPSVDYRFRNGDRVEFEAFRVRLDQLLEDVKAYIRSRPERLDWGRLEVNDIGRRLVFENESRYIGERVAGWSMALEPDPRHWDRRVSVTLPEELGPAGAYLLTAALRGGNTARVIVFTADTVIVEKPLHGGRTLFYLAEATSGKPLAGQPVEFFGYHPRPVKGTSRYEIEIAELTRRTDGDGQILLGREEAGREHRWLLTTRSAGGRLAYHGFATLWSLDRADVEPRRLKTFVMTDRPVYRPGDTVRFKLWAAEARHDRDEGSPFAGRSLRITVQGPRDERLFDRSLVADEFGGVAAELELPAEAPLGVYRILHDLGGETAGALFRVEEYKKPEFEVRVEAPAEPVGLGERIAATITARYFFGAPVGQAAVRYKVLRHDHDGRWYPATRWDWLYGPGYWWFAYDYDWLPGWGRWGCPRPRIGLWPPQPAAPPEVVAEGQAPIGADGTLAVPIDTGLARFLYGDRDHRYTIEAEVRDRSRRTVVGRGEVLVSREPFRVHAWTDRGHYRTGDTVQAGFKAQTIARRPVEGRGVLRLMRLEAAGGGAGETEVERWGLDTDAAGEARITITAARAGQYRLSYTVTDARGHAIEGGYVFSVRGEGEKPESFRFAKLELIADRADYRPGETVRLLVNTDRPGAAVLLFVRPVGGAAPPPRLLRLEGKSALAEIAVTDADTPNFFVEALTVYDGRLYNETREIAVPPEKRLLEAEVSAGRTRYRPGEKAELALRLTDARGAPFQGEAVLAVYDRALDYIAGGAARPAIRAFFWDWRRRHSPRTRSSLERWFGNLLRRDEPAMRPIGVFGDLVEEAAERGRPKMSRADGAAEMRVREAAAMAAPPMAGEPPERQAGPEASAADDAVRAEFADTAFWAARIRTDAQGVAAVEFPLPDNVTSWTAKVWAMGPGVRVGEGAAEFVAAKELLVRLQAPRFFVAGDEAVLSANVHNYREAEKRVTVKLELEGGGLGLAAGETAERTVAIPAQGETRVDWRVAALKAGEALVRMRARADTDSDAVQQRFPVRIHGFAKQVARTGALRPDEREAAIRFTVPAERRVESSRLELRYSPSLAAAMVDALPYLADYPYGCTEQTLNRFLPAVLTRQTLRKMGIDLEAVGKKRANLNPQELGDDRARAAGAGRGGKNPVFRTSELDAMVAAGVKRLADMQLADGGWGWFSGYGERSYAHTTALVVHGLQIAQANGVSVPPALIARGARWLQDHQERELGRLERWEATGQEGKPQADNLDALVHMVLLDQKIDRPEMRAYLYRDRNGLAVYGKAMLAMALLSAGERDRLEMLRRNIEQYLRQDEENQTAWLELPNGGYRWSWYGSETETHGYYLKLLARLEPQGAKAARLVKYLLNNRRHANRWESTRDTAVIVEAFADYLAATREADPELTVEILHDGKSVKRVAIDRANLFAFDNRLVLEGAAVASGERTLTIRKSGRGPLYFNAYLDYFSLEDFIAAEGLEIKIARRLYRLKAAEKTIATPGARGGPVERRVEKSVREPLSNLAELKSGELVEVELEIESKNDYEYLVFEDMKAAGFEPVDLQSGYTGNALGAYVEFRDEKVCFFVPHLARGRHSVSYRLRAEVPGRFSALPARAYAMYAPELKGNSEEIKLRVVD